MRIVFDASLCTGHGRCYAIAPEVFDADDQGHCVVIGGSDLPVPVNQEAAARTGVDNCPEGALAIVE